MVNPCIDRLSDLEYLKHMIPHHQVAIDMSNLLIPNTNNPTILHLCRDIIRKQGYEIWEMNMIMKRMIESPTSDEKGKKIKTVTKLDIYDDSIKKINNCDPLFFNPDDHHKHMEHMKINIKSYLKHMIPHHKVAIDMSRRLLLHSKNMYLIDFCKKLIYDQQIEIKKMLDLLKNSNFYYSELLNSEVIF